LVKPVYLPGYKPTYLCLMHMMTWDFNKKGMCSIGEDMY
jgi:hypothetical protein